jgi:predicted DCC family thiol-disulfide oxidoreductase YuxK
MNERKRMNKSGGNMMGERIVLFDGVCHLCQWSIQFIISHDPQVYFHFASLQSEIGKELLRSNGLSEHYVSSVVLVESGRIYTGSTAALRIAKQLTFPWCMLYGFMIVPKFIREPIYTFIAKNRYRWFGKDEVCFMPTQELKSRFLD